MSGDAGSDGHAVADRLLSGWQQFLTQRALDSDSLACSVLFRRFGGDAEAWLRTYLNEVPVALELIAPFLPARARVLEVGSGIGAVSRYLSELGHDVVACEPAPDGFDLMRQAAEVIDAACGPVAAPGSLRRLAVGVDELDPEELGRFNLVFSANVLEHVPDPYRAVVHLHRFLAPGGLQAHVCPNYAFPYDPHIARPLVPFVPQLTARLLPASLRDDAAFRTVNFITAGRLIGTTRRAGLRVELDRGLLGAAIRRFSDDPTFAGRHSGLGGVVQVLRTLRLDRLIGAIPPRFASPMRFTIRGAES